ncbi:MAG: hypothetical protein K0U13_03430 [Chlamydiae bacterium]|nr:hypothetical protein [Chlamydiota bacterium]
MRRASLFAVCGSALLLSTLYFPFKLPLFLSSLLLIAIGMRPLRQLQLLETRPHKLSFDGEVYCFFRKGKPLFSIPKEHIAKMEHQERGGQYGIAIDLCGQVDLHRKFDLPAFVTDSRTRCDCDLFLPFFTKRSLALIQDAHL